MNKEEVNIQFLGQFLHEGIYVLPEELKHDTAETKEEKREETKAEVTVTDEIVEENLLPKLPQLGEFRKQVLILVNNPKDSIITDEEKDFFGKLLPAIKLIWSDVAVVNIYSISENEQDLFDFANSYDYKFLLAFTGELSTLKLITETNLYQSIKSASKIHLISNPVSELNTDKAQKISLWKELQQIF